MAIWTLSEHNVQTAIDFFVNFDVFESLCILSDYVDQ